MRYLETQFIAYELTEDEMLQGLVLNIYQIAVLQNQINSVAQQIISMKMDPLNPMAYALDKAALQGQLETLQNQIDRSKETEKVLARVNSPQ